MGGATMIIKRKPNTTKELRKEIIIDDLRKIIGELFDVGWQTVDDPHNRSTKKLRKLLEKIEGPHGGGV
jgi:hypothetical protein